MVVSDFIVKTKAAIAQLTETDISASTVDLTNCDREPIHTPSAIQPHGVLVVVSADDWIITQVSQNTQHFLSQAPEALLGKPLQALLGAAQIEKLQACLGESFEAVNPLQLKIEPFEGQASESQTTFAGILHRSGAALVLELEPTERAESINFFDFYGQIKQPVSRLRQTQTLNGLFQCAVTEIKQVTGFDRVMVYQFDEDGSGQVIAEAKEAELSPYLGLHYPASDIPKQAKYLYLINFLRIIPDVDYAPVPMVAGDTDEEPLLDMSLSTLRSVSPLHTEYLRNMGVKATMSISLVQDNQLWGMIVCHHHAPRKISYEHRTICEFLGQAIALELAAKETYEDADYKLKINAFQASFVETLTKTQTLKKGLTQHPEQLRMLTGAQGVAFCEKGEITLLGQTPTALEVGQLVGWVEDQFGGKAVYQTSALSEVYPPASEFKDRTSGLLALAITPMQQLYILWFRPEVLQTVNWAGNPNKPVKINVSGEMTMSPRRSFALWQQLVQRRSRPWKPCEIEAALALRSAVIGLVVQRADELSQLNSELERSNIELDSFAYIASHDLKEPLRGIHNYSSFLIEDYGTTLDQDGVDKLNTLMQLTQRMESLINSLLHYSRLGRAELQLESVDLHEAVNGVIDMVKMSKPEAVTFTMPRLLPTVECDRTQATELFTNLITNAIKYNDKAEKQVEIGYLDPVEALSSNIIPPESALENALASEKAAASTVYYVQDNGIGIREKHLSTIFRIFKRLHAPKRFGGGTGAGLTIAKKIAERHGGILWLSSVYGEGSTFYFTLQSPSTE